MSTLTPNINLELDLGTEYYNVGRVTANWNKIDTAVGGLDTRTDSLEDKINTPDYSTITLDKTAQIRKVTDSYSGIAELVLKGDALFQTIKNGNFLTTANWSAVTASFSVANNVGTMTASIVNGRVAYNYNFIQNAKYFYRSTVKASSPLVNLNLGGGGVVSHSGSGQFEVLKSVVTWTAASGAYEFRVAMDTRTSGWDAVEFKDAMLIPITGTPYENMTAEEINNKIGAYFEGLKGATRETVGSRGKNLFGSLLEPGAYDTSTGLPVVNAGIYRSASKTRIKGSTNYKTTLSKADNVRAFFFDTTGAYISTILPCVTFTSPINAAYVNFHSSGFALDGTTFQLEEGTVATAYEPFDGSQVSITAVRYKLPNLVEDTLEFLDGRWLYYKRTKPVTMVAADVLQAYVNTTNNTIYETVDLLDTVSTVGVDNNIFVGGRQQVAFSNNDNIADRGKYMTVNSTKKLYFIFPLGTSLATAQAELAGTQVLCNLATPLVIEEKDFSAYSITIDGSLSANNGDTEFYVSGYDILADSLVTYPINISSGAESLKESVEGIRKNIGAGAWVKATTAPVILYVRADGSDSNDGSEDTPSKAIKTVQSAINRLPKYLKHGVYVRVAAGTYDEDVLVEGFIGRGALSIEGDTVSASTSRIVKSMTFIGCACGLSVKGFSPTLNTASSVAVLIDSCKFIRFWYMNLIASGTSLVGFYFASGSSGDIRSSVISNKINGILAQNSTVSSNGNTGTGNTYGLLATGGSKICKLGTQPSGIEQADSGGEISASLETLTINSGFLTGFTGVILLKKDSMGFVTANVSLLKDADISAGAVTLYTLPVGWRPLYASAVLINLNTAGGASIANSFATIAITSAGGVVLYPVVSTTVSTARSIPGATISYNTI